MGLAAILAIFTVGLAAGLLSGLIGIGGGVLIVPFLYFFYGHPEWFGVQVPPDLRTVVAHATSLLVIVPTSVRGALAFHRAGLVAWRAVWSIGIASVVGAVVGARLAPLLPSDLLKTAFGALLVVSAVRLLRPPARPAERAEAPEPRLGPLVTFPTGAAVGVFSALLGVGGGVISIPLLMHAVRLELRRVSATSIGIIAITAFAGTISYMVSGADTELPGWNLGYVDVGAGLAMFAGSVLSVHWGTRLNQRLSPRVLGVIFGGLFLAVGAQLLVENVPHLWAGR